MAYDGYSGTYDALDGGDAAMALGIDRLRAKAVARCEGRVLEVGVGTGLNLPLYDGARCSVVGVDLSQGMLREAAQTVAQRGLRRHIELQQMDAQQLTFADASFARTAFAILDSPVYLYQFTRTAIPEARCT